jgi:UDP-N-acetylglucosamine acyltransferase
MSSIHPTVKIHPSAIVEQGAQIDEGSVVGPFSTVGANVVIGKRTRIASHVTIEGYTEIKDDNQIFQFASVGSAPQDLKFHGEKTELIVGSGNIVREYVTLQPGTVQGGKRTVIADRNLFMAGSHVAHDAVVGSHNVFANYACLAGHVTVGNRVTLGGLVGVHQFVRVGDLAILGAGSMAAKDVPPFCMAQGDRCHLIGLNKIGLQRAGAIAEEIADLRRLYRKIFLGGGKFAARLEDAMQGERGSAYRDQLLSFLKGTSSRGLTVPRLTPRQRQDRSESEEAN